jgi:hypothetical protein
VKKLAAPVLLALVAALVVFPAAARRNCAWVARFDPALVNTAYPDQFANYWILALPAAPGATLTVKGLYPHARYMSLVSYAGAAQSADGLPDVAIEPDPAATTPSAPGTSAAPRIRSAATR